jgi:hypothetical protein
MLHFTTLHKFSLRLETHVLDGLLLTIASSVSNSRTDAIIDSTGIQPGSASYSSYYYIRTMSLRKGEMELRAVRQHIKLMLIID